MSACDGPEQRTVRVPVGPSQAALDALGTAVADLDAARTALLAAPEAVAAAATALDAADEACATGQRRLAADTRGPARAALTRVQAALATYATQVDAYRSTLATVVTAAEPLEPAQRQSLADLAAAGEREAAALQRFGAAAREVWPAYARLDEAQSLWLDRASAGWFRDQAEAADAYAVLRRPVEPELERARAALAQADAARRPATVQMRAALATANAALQSLRAPAG